tara:strand:+ start:147 stop:368 length:222 start_codon:yes stop_codon:yes gene_type:complete
MGNSHSCTEFRGGMIGSGCNPATGHTDPDPPKPKPPPVQPFVKSSTSLGLQNAEINQFNTSNMGGRMAIAPHS